MNIELIWLIIFLVVICAAGWVGRIRWKVGYDHGWRTASSGFPVTDDRLFWGLWWGPYGFGFREGYADMVEQYPGAYDKASRVKGYNHGWNLQRDKQAIPDTRPADWSVAYWDGVFEGFEDAAAGRPHKHIILPPYPFPGE